MKISLSAKSYRKQTKPIRPSRPSPHRTKSCQFVVTNGDDDWCCWMPDDKCIRYQNTRIWSCYLWIIFGISRKQTKQTNKYGASLPKYVKWFIVFVVVAIAYFEFEHTSQSQMLRINDMWSGRIQFYMYKVHKFNKTKGNRTFRSSGICNNRKMKILKNFLKRICCHQHLPKQTNSQKPKKNHLVSAGIW